MTAAVSQPARRNADERVSRSLATSSSKLCWLATGSPDSNVAWASQLPPPATVELRKPLREANPRAASRRVPSSRTAPTVGANSGLSSAERP